MAFLRPDPCPGESNPTGGLAPILPKSTGDAIIANSAPLGVEALRKRYQGT